MQVSSTLLLCYNPPTIHNYNTAPLLLLQVFLVIYSFAISLNTGLSTCDAFLCVTVLCGAFLCVTVLCGAFLCVTVFCGAFLCVTVLCVTVLCGAFLCAPFLSSTLLCVANFHLKLIVIHIAFSTACQVILFDFCAVSCLAIFLANGNLFFVNSRIRFPFVVFHLKEFWSRGMLCEYHTSALTGFLVHLLIDNTTYSFGMIQLI